ncbi:glycosyltransferase family 39 protein [Butyrivibrio sp. VCD2006]|uniref:glycosyltransferase family 39 protein n=1 Tax=Butyrivibrio sp. VCD2006 TaxID=1280664 RepID=UPI0004204601|nr:glycosyltransferase family 39 protein [Butyrivibrio sp. VCD2006]
MLSENKSADKGKLYFLIIYIIAICSRLIFLKSSPAGLHVDEAGMAYDAYCLANYGVDRNLISFPVYLINFGGGQSALYAYVAALFIKFLGLNIIAIRLPGVLFSLITLFAGEEIVKRVCGEDSAAAYIYPILYAICPAFVMSARFGLDCNLMLGMTTLFLYGLMRAVSSGKAGDYALVGVFAGVSLYTYAICYAIMPIFLMVFFLILLFSRKLNVLRVVCFVVPLGILALPLLVTQYVNITGSESIVFGIITMPALTFYRGGEIMAPTLSGLTNALKSIFLYDSLDYNSIPAFGTMYYITIPFIAVGLIRTFITIGKSAKEKELSFALLPLVWFLSELLVGSMLGGDGPNVNKMNGIFFTLAFFAAFGMDAFLLLFSKNKKVYVAAGAVLGAVFLAFGGAFFTKYLGSYSDNLYLFQKPLDEPIKVLSEDEFFADRQVVVIHNNQPYIPPYIYYLLGSKLSPYEFNMGDTSFYGRYLFNMPEELSPDYVYLVFDGNPEAIETLYEIGCNQIMKFDGSSIVWCGEPSTYVPSEDETSKIKGIPFGHDLPFHLRRIAGITEGLKFGEFPVKMQHYWFNNYGYPVGVMYGDVLLYIPAVLHLLGMPLWMAYMWYFVLIQLVTALTAYLCFKYISGDRITGALCMLLYVFSFWRLTDLLSREAVGEYSAFAFLPLIVLGLARIHRNENKVRGVILLGAGMTGLFVTHLLSVVMAALFIFIFVIVDIKTMLSEGRWKSIIGAAAGTLIFNLGQLVPLMDYYKNAPMLINSGEKTPIQTFGITWRQLGGAFYNVLAPIMELGTEPVDELPQSPGLAMLLICIISVVFLIREKRAIGEKAMVIVLTVLSVFALILSTCYFPYDFLYSKVPFLFKLLGSIQYPARYLTAATMLICTLYAVMRKQKPAYTMSIILLALTLWQSGGYINTFLEKQTNIVSIESIDEWTSFDDDRQYMLTGTDLERLQYASVLPSTEEITYDDENREKGEYSLHLVNSSSEEGFADLPLLAYPYYYATDGSMSYGLSAGDNNKLRITLPAGCDSVIKIRFREPVYWRIAELITLGSVIVLIAIGIMGKRRNKK